MRGDEPELFAPPDRASLPEAAAPAAFNVPAKFVELAKAAILHRDPERFAMLYRLLWRLRSHHDLLEVATDPDVAQVAAMAKAVRRDEHKMHAFVRFREVGREPAVALTSPGSSRSITSSKPPRRSSRAASPTWPGRS